MTKSPLSRRVRRLALSCTIAAAASLAAPPSAHPTLFAADALSAASQSSASHVLDDPASDNLKTPVARRGGIQIIVHQLKAAANAAEATAVADDLVISAVPDSSPADELFGLGTHDSNPFIRSRPSAVSLSPLAPINRSASTSDRHATGTSLDPAGLINWISAPRTSDSFNQLLHSIGVDVCANTGVQFDQSAEPFVAVETEAVAWDQDLPAFRRWRARQQPTRNTHTGMNAWHLGAADLPTAAKFVDTCAQEYSEYYGETANTTDQNAWQEIAAVRQEQLAFEQLAFDESTNASDDANFDVAAHVPVVDFDGILPIGDHWIADPNFIVDDNFRLKAVIDHGDSARPDWEQLDDASFRVVSREDLLRRQLDALARDEPVDVDFAVGQQVAKSKFVGSGPVIATISETYSSYDVAESDLELWSVLPFVAEPFCIRGRSIADAPSPLWKVDNRQPSYVLAPAISVASQSTTLTVEPFDFDKYGSPDCVLEDWRWRAELAVYDYRHMAHEFTPVAIGRRIGRGVRNGTDAAASLIARIGSALPVAAPAQARPLETPPAIAGEPTAGQRLIARAGATADPAQVSNSPEDLRAASQKLDQLISVARRLGQRFLR